MRREKTSAQGEHKSHGYRNRKNERGRESCLCSTKVGTYEWFRESKVTLWTARTFWLPVYTHFLSSSLLLCFPFPSFTRLVVVSSSSWSIRWITHACAERKKEKVTCVFFPASVFHDDLSSAAFSTRYLNVMGDSQTRHSFCFSSLLFSLWKA